MTTPHSRLSVKQLRKSFKQRLSASAEWDTATYPASRAASRANKYKLVTIKKNIYIPY